MGSYANLSVSNHLIHLSKSYVNNEVMTLFTTSDKTGNGEVCKYTTTVKIAINRLEIMGFTLDRVEQDLVSSISVILERLKEYIDDSLYRELNLYDAEFAMLETLNFSSLVKAFTEIRIAGFEFYDEDALKTYNNLSDEAVFLLKETHLFDDTLNDGRLLNYPSPNIRLFLRAYLESCNKDESIVLDLSDVVSSGYYNENDDIKSISSSQLIGEYDKNSKIIILTEGSSDKTMIEDSLCLLYPHLVDYYSFMEFNEYKTKGGASSLVEQVKAFSGAGIKNRIVAIFDNDTAAYDAQRALEKINLPNNISICNYPDIPIAENYPTLGPSGKEIINVNGLAASLEMYLGKDTLEEEEGELISVQWKGYNEVLKNYHGELLSKKKIQNRFYERLAECKKDSEKISNYDWSGIELILHSIFDNSRLRG